LYRVHYAMNGAKTPNLVVIGTDCTGSCKSNYHTITTTTAPSIKQIIFCKQKICIITTLIFHSGSVFASEGIKIHNYHIGENLVSYCG